ncbi:hypothetical protein [[Ruminococcus] torques]|nr:hypothetical protein [[Ruminococcus] torques]
MRKHYEMTEKNDLKNLNRYNRSCKKMIRILHNDSYVSMEKVI